MAYVRQAEPNGQTKTAGVQILKFGKLQIKTRQRTEKMTIETKEILTQGNKWRYWCRGDAKMDLESIMAFTSSVLNEFNERFPDEPRQEKNAENNVQ